MPDIVLAQPILQEISMIATSMKFRALTRNVLGGLLTAVHRRIVRNATERTLSYMDDRMLRDVGLTRFEIYNALPACSNRLPKNSRLFLL